MAVCMCATTHAAHGGHRELRRRKRNEVAMAIAFNHLYLVRNKDGARSR